MIKLTDQVKPEIMEKRIDAIRELTLELNRVKLKNLRLKTHMQVLISHPLSKTAGKIRQKQSPGEIVSKEFLTGSMN